MTKVVWPSVPLGEVAYLDNLLTSVTPTLVYDMAGVRSFGRGLFARGPLEGNETKYKAFHEIREDQIILSQLKGWEGAIAFATTKYVGCQLPPHNACFSVARDRADPHFLRWFLKQEKVWNNLRSSARGMGARRDTVSVDTFLDLTLPLPTLIEQRHIVARLDTVAAAIEARACAVSEMELEINATLKSGFQKITKAAARVRMSDLAPLVRRPIDVDTDGAYPELGVRSFGKGTFHKPELSGLEIGTKRLFRIEKGDLLFNIVFAWEGAVAVAKAEDNGRVGSHRFLARVPDPSRATSEFLRYFFLTDEGLQCLGEASPGGAGRNRTLGLQGLDDIVVPTPSLEAQQWFDALQAKGSAARTHSAEAAADLERLIPAMLNQVF